MPSSKPQVNVRVAQATLDQARAYADEQGVSLARVVEASLDEFLAARAAGRTGTGAPWNWSTTR